MGTEQKGEEIIANLDLVERDEEFKYGECIRGRVEQLDLHGSYAKLLEKLATQNHTTEVERYIGDVVRRLSSTPSARVFVRVTDPHDKTGRGYYECNVENMIGVNVPLIDKLYEENGEKKQYKVLEMKIRGFNDFGFEKYNAP